MNDNISWETLKNFPTLPDALREIERLRESHSMLFQYAADADARIEELRIALALSVSELSTHSQYAVYSPDQLMQQFLEEARRD